MAATPKSINVTVNAEELQKLQRAYEDRLDRQRDRISLLIAYLEHKGLVDDFNAWEEANRAK